MTVSGYANDVLVDADWAQAHLDDPTVRFVEVDVDTTAYDQSHLPGRRRLELDEPARRRHPPRHREPRGVQQAPRARAASARTRRSSCTATTTTGSPPGPTGSSSCSATATSGSSTAAASSGSTTACRCRPTRRRIAATAYELPEPDFALRAFHERHPAAARSERLRARRRPLAGRVQRRGHRASGHDRDRPAGRPHPGRRLDPVGPDGPRGRHVQGARGAREPVRGEGRHPRQGRDRLLPDRRALEPLVVRPPRAPRLPAGPQLRRLVDRVGQHGRRCRSRSRPRSPPAEGSESTRRSSERRTLLGRRGRSLDRRSVLASPRARTLRRWIPGDAAAATAPLLVAATASPDWGCSGRVERSTRIRRSGTGRGRRSGSPPRAAAGRPGAAPRRQRGPGRSRPARARARRASSRPGRRRGGSSRRSTTRIGARLADPGVAEPGDGAVGRRRRTGRRRPSPPSSRGRRSAVEARSSRARARSGRSGLGRVRSPDRARRLDGSE